MIEQVLRQLESLQRELARINPSVNGPADQVAAMAQALRTASMPMSVPAPRSKKRPMAIRAA